MLRKRKISRLLIFAFFIPLALSTQGLAEFLTCHLTRYPGDPNLERQAQFDNFFDPKVICCTLLNRCEWVRPGGNMKVWTVENPIHFGFACASVYLSHNRQQVCVCYSHNKCYTFRNLFFHARGTAWYEPSGKVTQLCRMEQCWDILYPKHLPFCGFLVGKKRLKFVPISFSAQTYFHPGIRVVLLDGGNASGGVGGMPHAHDLYLDYENGETTRQAMVYLAGEYYRIEVEKMKNDMICGSYESRGIKHRECMPTPPLRKPRVFNARDQNRNDVIRVRFAGCQNKRKCNMTLRVGDKLGLQAASHLRLPVNAEVIRAEFDSEHALKQIAICPEGVNDDAKYVDKVLRGDVQCQDGSMPVLKYKSGNGLSRCLAIYQDFSNSHVFRRNILFVTHKLMSEGTAVSHPGIRMPVSYNYKMLRNTQGQLDRDAYISTFEHLRRTSKYRDIYGKDGVELVSIFPEKQDMGYHSVEKKLYPADTCSHIPGISLNTSQKFLDSISKTSEWYFVPEGALREVLGANIVDASCLEDGGVRLYYKTLPTKDRENAGASIGDPYDQGLCIGSERIPFTSDGSRSRRSGSVLSKKKQYQYRKKNLLFGCHFIGITMFVPPVLGGHLHGQEYVKAIVINKSPQYGVVADITLARRGSARTNSSVIMCPNRPPYTRKNYVIDFNTMPCIGFTLLDKANVPGALENHTSVRTGKSASQYFTFIYGEERKVLRQHARQQNQDGKVVMMCED